MNFSAIIHQPKSEYSYAYNEDTLHLRLKTAREDVTAVEVLAVDPFNWVPRNDGSGIYDFDKQSVVRTFMKKEQETLEHDCWFVEITGIPSKRTKYCFVVENAEEKYIIGCHGKVPYTLDESVLYNLFNYFNYPFINEEDLYEAPNWVGNTVWYQIFPERFCNGTPNDDRDVLPWGSDELDGAEKKFGGNLAGIIQKLDYIKSLGVTGIYFTPMFASPSSHKYDTSDYFTIDKEFGNNETLGQLVEEAHKRGIKVMLDAVFNHCGFYHPFWQDVLKNGTKSKYIDYFQIDGCTPIQIFYKIVLPLSKAALASIGLMFAVAYWNDYTSFKLYITNADLYNFQMKLRSLILGSDLPSALGDATENTVKNAAVMVAIIPFMFIYPFCQKYFISGINIGAVKE